MSAIADFCNVIRGWLNLGSEVYPDDVVTSWVRMVEGDLSVRLRCKDMIEISTATIEDTRGILPPDWRELDFVRPVGGKPRRYVPRDDFYNTDEPFASDQKNCYTIIGNFLVIGGVSETAPVQVEVAYYQSIPPLGEDPTWLYTLYYQLLLMATLNVGSMYSIEDERSSLWKTESDRLVDDINREHMNSKASGSRLTARNRRSFG